MPTVMAVLRPAIADLLGGATIEAALKGERPLGSMKEGATLAGPKQLVLTFASPDRGVQMVTAKRNLPFAESEVLFCDELLKAVSALYDRVDDRHYQAHFRTALLSSAFDIAVTRVLRGSQSSTFGTIQTIIRAFQDLTFRRYEGQPVTTALLFMPQPSKWQKRASKADIRVDLLDKPVNVASQIFDNPLSFLLISGELQWYISNLQGTVFAVASCSSTSDLDWIGLGNGQQLLRGLALTNSERSFGIRVTRQSEVHVLSNRSLSFLWRRNRWYLFEQQIIRDFLASIGVSADLANQLAIIAFAMSGARHGAVIMIARESQKTRILIKGSVGSGPLATALAARVRNRSILELRASGELEGILSSDGVLQLSPEGEVLHIGVVVNTDLAVRGLSGGGRTMAASAASHRQLKSRVIKVSQDGTIDLFEAGRSVYRFG